MASPGPVVAHLASSSRTRARTPSRTETLSDSPWSSLPKLPRARRLSLVLSLVRACRSLCRVNSFPLAYGLGVCRRRRPNSHLLPIGNAMRAPTLRCLLPTEPYKPPARRHERNVECARTDSRSEKSGTLPGAEADYIVSFTAIVGRLTDGPMVPETCTRSLGSSH